MTEWWQLFERTNLSIRQQTNQATGFREICLNGVCNFTKNPQLKQMANINKKLADKKQIAAEFISAIKENIQLSELDMKKKRITFFSAVISMIGLLLCYGDNELYYKYDRVNTNTNHVLRIFVIFFTLILAYSIYLYYQKCLEKLKFKNQVHPQTTLFQYATLRNQFLFELCANLILYPPYLDIQIEHNFNNVVYTIPANAYIFMFMLLRIYILLRVLQNFSYWNNLKAQRVCEDNDFSASLMFMIKAGLKTNPFKFVIFSLLVLIFVLGLSMRNIERYHETSYRVFQFNNVFNTLWCIILAITTIGYGDIYPISIGGRFIAIIAGITGSVILSILINIIQTLTTFIPNENEAFEFLVERQKIQKILLNESTRYIQKMWMLFRLRRKKIDYRRRLMLYIDCMSLQKRLRLKRQQIKNNKLGLNDILNQMKSTYDHEIQKVKEELSDCQDLKSTVQECAAQQRAINSKTFTIFRNQQFIYELARSPLYQQ